MCVIEENYPKLVKLVKLSKLIKLTKLVNITHLTYKNPYGPRYKPIQIGLNKSHHHTSDDELNLTQWSLQPNVIS